MRIYILIASAAALAACGGSTAPASSSAPDASSDVAIDHVVGQGSPNKGSAGEMAALGKGADEKHAPPGPLDTDASSGDSSGGVTDAGAGSDAAPEAAGPFSCGGVMCMPPGQYCSVNKTSFGNNTSSQCMQTPFNCDAGPTCGCLSPFDGGMPGCTCADNSGAVTLTCPY